MLGMTSLFTQDGYQEFEFFRWKILELSEQLLVRCLRETALRQYYAAILVSRGAVHPNLREM